MLDFLKLKKTISSVGHEANKLRSEIEEKKQRRDYLETSPLPVSEFCDGIDKMIDVHAATYPAQLLDAVRGLINTPQYDFESAYLDLLSIRGGSAHRGTLQKENACWFFGALIKQRIRDAVIDIWPEQEAGPPAKERQVEIRKLGSEIDKLEDQLKALRESAEAAGITLSRADPEPVRPGLFAGGRPLGKVDTAIERDRQNR